LRSVAILLAAGIVAAGGFKEPRTGISFSDTYNGGKLSKVGVRTKGPIKVYAVGLYEKGKDETYVLKMSYGVGAQKMTSALSEALKPRCKDSSLVAAFEECLLKGLPDGAPKGTCLAFATGGGKLALKVNDKPVGTVASKPLAAAFAGIYSDNNAVCAMQSTDEAADESNAHHGMITPERGMLAGAAIGYGIGKLLS